eukprot:TRINITY_DN16102_c0_g1_i1.p1 TRINITY_DN16102_c0_g1~~TRINITY_DN16102_c0_g1_i1.p1  ORF type:complete len:773 (-),score=158.68 TRINITY_DN16102_c0_g1_i1:127-2445(-)
MDQRCKVIQEILDTERSYLEDLSVLVKIYYRPLLGADILARTEIPQIFGNVTVIEEVNKKFCTKLEERLEGLEKEDYVHVSIGDIFLQSANKFKAPYSKYCSNFRPSITVVQYFTEKLPSFAEFGLKCKNHPDAKKLDLGAYLIKPVQRVCKYPLLLRELIKCTPQDHTDYADLNRALEMLQEVTADIDSAKADAETFQILEQIQNKLDGFQVVAGGRRFIKEGPLSKLNEKGSPQERYFFLFNDVLIFAKPKRLKGKYDFRGTIPLASTILRENDEAKNSFKLIIMDGTQKFHILRAKTAENKQEWASAIEKAINENLEKKWNTNPDENEDLDNLTAEAADSEKVTAELKLLNNKLEFINRTLQEKVFVLERQLKIERDERDAMRAALLNLDNRLAQLETHESGTQTRPQTMVQQLFDFGSVTIPKAVTPVVPVLTEPVEDVAKKRPVSTKESGTPSPAEDADDGSASSTRRRGQVLVEFKSATTTSENSHSAGSAAQQSEIRFVAAPSKATNIKNHRLSDIAQIIRKQGMLLKKGYKRRNWTSRRFVLTTTVLKYYKDKDTPQGKISLAKSKLDYLPRKKFCCFSISTTDRIYYFCAKNEEEMFAWVTTIYRCVKDLPAELRWDHKRDFCSGELETIDFSGKDKTGIVRRRRFKRSRKGMDGDDGLELSKSLNSQKEGYGAVFNEDGTEKTYYLVLEGEKLFLFNSIKDQDPVKEFVVKGSSVQTGTVNTKDEYLFFLNLTEKSGENPKQLKLHFLNATQANEWLTCCVT